MHPMLAIRAFFKALFCDAATAEQFTQVLSGAEVQAPPAIEESPKPADPPKPKPAPAPKPPARSEALTLLAALQREARFVDIVKEPLSDYSDDQIGAAARDVLRDCGAVLDRMFKLEELSEAEEDSELTTPDGFDPNEYRLTGNVEGEPPFTGTVMHRGWKATQCEIPKWSGSDSASRIVAPVEIEIN